MKTVEELTSELREQPPYNRFKPPLGYPPCNGCTLCCKNHGKYGVPINVKAGDDPSDYPEAVVRPDGLLTLPVKSNGDCKYLGQRGCTIHEKAPAICRVFDCRVAYLGRGELSKANRHSVVVARGKELYKRGLT